MKEPINKITYKDAEAFRHDGTMLSYQEVATKSAIYPGQGTPLGLVYCGLKLNGEAGELAEHIGKAMRDDALMGVGGHLSDERKHLVIKEIGDVLWYLSAICNELNITLEYAATTNLRKLAGRTERDKLQGSGDDR